MEVKPLPPERGGEPGRYMFDNCRGLNAKVKDKIKQGLQLVTPQGPHGRPVARLVLASAPPGGKGTPGTPTCQDEEPQQAQLPPASGLPCLILHAKQLRKLWWPALNAHLRSLPRRIRPGQAHVQVELDGALQVGAGLVRHVECCFAGVLMAAARLE